MIRLSKILLFFTATVLLAWILPWACDFLIGAKPRTPFTLYSTVSGEFVSLQSGDRGIEYRDATGRTFTEREFDSLLPFFYYRQLIADNRFPDTIRGTAVTPRMAQTQTFMFRSSPREVNATRPGIYPMLESMSGRVDLETPTDVFRIDRQGITFIDCATNSVMADKSSAFTGMLRKKGFTFPARIIAGNPTTRKEYDEGYVLLDADRRMFHLKMVQGRPYVRAIALPEGVRPEHLFITEYHSRRTLALLTDDRSRLYAVCMPGYEVRRVEGVSYDPERESISIIGTLLHWTVCVEGDSAERCYAVAADNLALLDTLSHPLSGRHLPGLAFTSSQDNYVRPRLR